MGTFKIRYKSKDNFSAFSETINHKIDEPKVEMVQYAEGLVKLLRADVCLEPSDIPLLQ
jgi:hypothetical protein